MHCSEREALVPFFAALCLFLSAVEYAIPKPLPFMRLGLANLPVLLSLATMRRRDTLLLIALKVIGQALISGTLFSYIFVFSASGSFASALTMLVLHMLFYKTNKLSNIGLSLAGAFANNVAQIAVARIMIFGENARYIAPILFTTGLGTGFVLGVFANIFCQKSQWYHNLLINNFARETISLYQSPSSSARESTVPTCIQFIQSTATPATELASDSVCQIRSTAPSHARVHFIVAMILIPLFLLQQLFMPRAASDGIRVCVAWCCVVVFFCMVAIKKRGNVKLLPSVFMTLGITFFALLTPSGKVLFAVGRFRVTYEALLLGLRKSAVIVGMVFLSQFAIDPRLALPGKAGAFLNKMFAVFDALTSRRLRFKKGHIIEALDAHLMELWQLCW